MGRSDEPPPLEAVVRSLWPDDGLGPSRKAPASKDAEHLVAVAEARVLIVANESRARLELEKALRSKVDARSVGGASSTEGIGADVVVIGGSFPLAEIVEVRAHPRLFDKPVVLFAPGRELPSVDWRALNIWPVITRQDPFRQLVIHVRNLLRAPLPA